ncbi:unnamed protein product [Aphanomyces euteiches]|uniref:Uncharacterized protein n=1 Tax=Aphanomyces euteiches TaxID=100861 RepID=A0A6G0WT57_9STRA|nr:hypothetical protein Ae201684_012041 [Aphanomyces euteiches]KAH9056089.1 hypothetical protein Ae201684P_021827 [Aphanomyces euteiches]KAH9133114.1 hypothetical protein AeRB84_020726 [Aphanomyces euteiches]
MTTMPAASCNQPDNFHTSLLESAMPTWLIDSTDSLAFSLVPSPDEKCCYRTGKCLNVRAFKRNGKRHKLCDFHREKANLNQLKLDRKKRQHRSGSDDDMVALSSPKKQKTASIEMPMPLHEAPLALAWDELDFFCTAMTPSQQYAFLDKVQLEVLV